MSELGTIDHIGVMVQDLDVALAFFHETMGLPIDRRIELPGGGRAAFLGHGGALLELVELGDAALRQERTGGGPARLDHVAFAVGDTAQAAAALRERGVAMQSDEPMAGAGGKRVIFTDPASSGGITVQLYGS